MATPGAPSCGYDHDDASRGRAHDVRDLAPVTMLPPGLCAWEEWERRTQHREACIEAVKRSPDYIAVAQHLARPLTPDPRQPEVSKRAWEKSVRQWRMDLKALVTDGLAGAAAGSAGAGRVDEPEPLHVPWPSELCQPMYVTLPPASIDEEEAAAFVSVPEDEPLHVPWPSQRARQRSRSPLRANEECNEEVWQRRSKHRAAGVAAVKRSADYITAAANPHVPRYMTPDPTDRRLSKRAWERGVQQWRENLKTVVGNLEIHYEAESVGMEVEAIIPIQGAHRAASAGGASDAGEAGYSAIVYQ